MTPHPAATIRRAEGTIPQRTHSSERPRGPGASAFRAGETFGCSSVRAVERSPPNERHPSKLDEQARTWLLLAALTALFILIGFLLGGAFIWLFVAFSVLMNVAAYFWSDKFAIRASRAQWSPKRRLRPAQDGERAGRAVPGAQARVYMIPSEQPNAFATGRNPQHAAVAVTQGLLQHMPYDQVRGVMAHEFAHIKNRDILVSSIAAMIAGAVSAVGNIFFFTAMFGGDDDEPARRARGDRADDHRAARRSVAAARRLPAARVPRRRDRRPNAPRGKPLADALENLEAARHVVPMAVNRPPRRCTSSTRSPERA